MDNNSKLAYDFTRLWELPAKAQQLVERLLDMIDANKEMKGTLIELSERLRVLEEGVARKAA